MLRVAVIGSGAAGTAAAWALARAGAEVAIFSAQSGATALYSGAVDLVPWDSRGFEVELEPDLVLFAQSLGCWSLGPETCRIATSNGVLRSARGIDTALLNLAPLSGRRVAVANVAREDWDGPLLARALAQSEWARSTRTEFESRPVELLQSSVERRIPLYDFAQSFDGASRSEGLVRALQAARGTCDAWLLGPWLGTLSDTSERIRRALGFAVGETTSLPGGPAGARFEQAREQLLTSLGSVLRHGRALRLEPRFSGWTVHFVDAERASAAETLEAEAVVLATGGVAAGGVRILRARGAVGGNASFGLSLDVSVTFRLDGHIFDGASSLYGIDFQGRGAVALERLGIAAKGQGVFGQTGLFVAGDAVADRPRTVLEAARSGIAAAKSVLASISQRPSRPPPPV